MLNDISHYSKMVHVVRSSSDLAEWHDIEDDMAHPYILPYQFLYPHMVFPESSPQGC
jgi:hypothetical protein